MGAIVAGYVGFAWHLPVGMHLLVAVARRRRSAARSGAGSRAAQGPDRRARGDHHDHAQLHRALPARLPARRSRASSAAVPDQAISKPIARHRAAAAAVRRRPAGRTRAACSRCSPRSGVWWLLDALHARLQAPGGRRQPVRRADRRHERRAQLRRRDAARRGAAPGWPASARSSAPTPRITGDIDAGIGFDAITVALLGRARPCGRAGRAAVRRVPRRRRRHAGGRPAPRRASSSSSSRVIVLFIAAPALIRGIFRLRAARGGGRGGQLAKGWNG